MAKNRKKKAKDKDAAASSASDSSSSPSASPSTSSAPASSSSSVPATAADVAMKSGNYSAVRHMAAHNDAKAQALLPLTQIDMGQIIVGLIGMLVVLTVAFFVLHGR